MTKEELISKINEENKIFEEKVKRICREYAQEHAVFKNGYVFTTKYSTSYIITDSYWCNLRSDVVYKLEEKYSGDEYISIAEEDVLRLVRDGIVNIIANEEK